MKRFSWLAGLTAGVCLALAGSAYAGRSGGTFTYTAPAGSVVAGTPITKSWADALTSQTAQALTDSLDRNGSGGMMAALKLTDGGAGAPSLTFNSETGSGVFRAATNDVRMSIAGTAKQSWTPAGTSILGALTTSGATTLQSTLGVTGATTLSSTLGVAGNLAVNTDKFAVTAASGNTSIAGTLGVTGAATFTGGFTSSATSYLSGAALWLTSANPAQGTIYLGNTSNEYLWFDGSRYNFGNTGKPLAVGTPLAGGDAAPKSYVDTAVNAAIPNGRCALTGAGSCTFVTTAAWQTVMLAGTAVGAGSCTVAVDGTNIVTVSGAGNLALAHTAPSTAGTHTLTAVAACSRAEVW